ncbi:MAG: hypothetical protein AB7T18_16785 [Alphaproteobacteria bacterium]
MTRLGVVFWSGLVLASGFATFNVKYSVQGIDDELARVRRQTVAEQQEIRVLSAEWAYLNQPERLAELNRSLLQLAPMTAKQLQGRIEDIALRPPRAPAPDATPQTMMAAAPPAAGGPPDAAPTTAPIPAISRVETLLAAAPAAARLGDAQAANIHAGRGAEHAADAGGTETVATKARPADAADDAQAADRNRVALAEAMQLLGIDAGADHPRTWLAKAAPIASAQAAEARGGGATGGETQVADVAAAPARPADTSKGAAAAALAEALRVLGGDSGGQAPRVRLAKAAPASLAGLISKIADSR